MSILSFSKYLDLDFSISGLVCLCVPTIYALLDLFPGTSLWECNCKWHQIYPHLSLVYYMHWSLYVGIVSSYLLICPVNFSVGLPYVDNSTSKRNLSLPFLWFSCLLALIVTSFTLWNKSSESEHPHKVPKHRRGAFSIS